MKKVWVLISVLFVFINWHCRRSDDATGIVDQSRPNIIFLLADDMRYDALGCTGNKYAITPNIDNLAAEGTNFKNNYVTTSICAISRASILTGQYAKRHGITDFDKNLSATALLNTYPVLLRNHGYYTGFIGKYGVGADLSAPSTLFDYWKGYPGHGVYFYRDASGNLVHETTLMEQEAKEFIDHRDASKPFCLSVSFKAPHSEDGVTENNGFRPDPFFNNWYSGVTFPLPETYADRFYSQFPADWRKSQKGVENEGHLRNDMRFSTAEKFQVTTHAIYRLVSGLDKAVGELRDFLKAKGLDKNTIIVFTSDNGYYMGEHGLEGKWYGHEESIHTPLIIYDPRMPQQRKIVDEMALNVDIAPTILTWAGIGVPYGMQGKALEPLLTGTADGWRENFFYEHPYESGDASYIPKSVGFVTSSWKYMRYYNGNNSGKHVVYEELFNVANDPHEKKNRINEEAQKSRVATFKQKVAQWEQRLK